MRNRAREYTTDDFLHQLAVIERDHYLKDLMQAIPGMHAVLNEIDADRDLRRLRGIIHSMTPQERDDGSLLNESRLRRIAFGAGVGVNDVSPCIADYYRMRLQARRIRELLNNSERR